MVPAARPGTAAPQPPSATSPKALRPKPEDDRPSAALARDTASPRPGPSRARRPACPRRPCLARQRVPSPHREPDGSWSSPLTPKPAPQPLGPTQARYGRAGGPGLPAHPSRFARRPGRRTARTSRTAAALPRGNGPISFGPRPASSGSSTRPRRDRNPRARPRAKCTPPPPVGAAAARRRPPRRARTGRARRRRPARAHAGPARRAGVLRPRRRRGRRTRPGRRPRRRDDGPAWDDGRPPGKTGGAMTGRPSGTRPPALLPRPRQQDAGERHPPPSTTGCPAPGDQARPRLAQPPHRDDSGAGHRAGGRGGPGPGAADRPWAEVQPAHREPAPGPDEHRRAAAAAGRGHLRHLSRAAVSAGSSRPSTASSPWAAPS